MKELLFAAFLLAQGQVGTTVETGAVTGRLLSKNGAPAASVRIAAMPVPADNTGVPVLVSISQTDDDGRYRLADLPPGRYHIFAGLIDHPNYYPGTASLADAAVVTIDPGATIAGIDFKLTRPAAIRVSGRISGPANIPDLAGRTVTLSPRGRGAALMTTTLDADGAFTFSPVSPGDYQLASTVPGASTLSVTVADDDLTDVLLPAVDCNSGVEVRGRLTGTPTVRVDRISFTGAKFRCTPVATVSPDGAFVLSNVPVDEYSVRLTPTPMGWFGANVVVNPAGMNELEIPFPRMFEIRGQVALQDGGAIPRLSRGSSVAIQARSAPGNQILTQNIRNDGSFTLRLIPGRYYISVPAVPKNYVVRSIISSEFVDLLSQPLHVTDSSQTEIQITLGADTPSRAGVRVSGRIIPATGGALQKPEGVLLASSSGGRNAAFLSASVEVDGSFEFRGVSPGRYDLMTFPDSPVALRDIDVSRTDVTELELAMPVLFKVNGALQWIDAVDGASSPAPQSLSVQFAKHEQSQDQDSGLFVWAALARAGSFQVYLPEGDYRFSITGVPRDAEIVSATFGALELLETDLPVHSSLDPMNVRVTVRQ
jgi:hypothetical protein